MSAATCCSPRSTATRKPNSRSSSAMKTSWVKARAKEFNFNYLLPAGSGWDTWSAALDQACKEIDNYGADIVVVSLGVDTFKDDPISQFKLDSPDYLAMGERIARLGKPTLFVMEGGYAVEEIGINAVNVLEGFESAQ